jgi:hypothetical protein
VPRRCQWRTDSYLGTRPQSLSPSYLSLSQPSIDGEIWDDRAYEGTPEVRWPCRAAPGKRSVGSNTTTISTSINFET